MIVALLALACSEIPLTSRSLFGHEGRDEVILELADGFQILEEVPKPTVKHIKEAKFTDTVINDADYPWNGHGFRGTCTWALLQQETNAIFSRYYNVDVSQENLYYHPAGLKQFLADNEEAINNAPRYKCRVTLTPKYYKHAAPIFMPPGEVVTITLPDDAVNKVYVNFNKYMDDIGSDENGNCRFNQRINRLRFKDLKLSKKVNKIGFPAGAALTFTHSASSAISFEISGVILSPCFQYGVTSDEEWEKIKKYPGPVVYLGTGNIFAVMPSRYVRGSTRINDVMKFWRSAYQISQTSAQDNYPNNPRDGRILNPPEFNFDNWVAYGWAFAMVGANYCQFPLDGISGFIDWNSLQDNCWGVVHEMDHHHQGSWANGGSDEMSNNAINLQIYARTNSASSPRGPKGENLWSWSKYSHPYLPLSYVGNDGGLPHYADMLHFFGADKYRDFIRSDQYNTLYNRNDPKLGRRGAQLLRASKIFGYNMRYNFNFHGFDDNSLKNGNAESITFTELDKLNLPPFHPVTTTYGVGYVIDGKEFETARPFRIQPVPTELNFISTMKTRDDKEKFGDFEFQKIEPINNSKFVEKSKGIYILTPNDDPSILDGCYAHYLDKKTNKVTIIICKFIQQTPYRVRFVRYSKIGGGKTIFEAYNQTKLMKPVEDWNSQQFYCGKITNDNSGWVAVASAVFHVEETDTYEFGIFKADDIGALYLSEKELSFDPDEDEPYLLVNSTWRDSWENVVPSKPIKLEAYKKYYVALVIYNPANKGAGQGYAAMRKANKSETFYQVPQKYITKNGFPFEKYWRAQFHPGFFEIPYLDVWDGVDMVQAESGNWNVYSVPAGRAIRNSNSGQGTEDWGLSATQVLTDQDPTTEYRVNWWQGGGQSPVGFAHIFKIDMGKLTTFETLKIGGTANPGWFDMESEIEIRLGHGDFPIQYDNGTVVYDPDNVTIQQGQSIIINNQIYKTSNPYFHFNPPRTGRYLQIKVLTNTKKWKDGWAGRSSISSVEVGTMIPKSKVLPSTFSKLNYSGDWKKTYDGFYYNGVAQTGTAGAEIVYEVPDTHGEFGLVGDLWKEMGTADVFLDGNFVYTIDKNLIRKPDEVRMRLAHRSFKQLLYFTKFDTTEKKKHLVKIVVKTGEITVAGFITDCSGKGCFYDPSEDHEIDGGEGGNPHDKGEGANKINGKTLSKSGSTAIAVIVVILVVAGTVAVFIVGAKKGFWCRPPEDSDIMVEKFAI